jgi:tetratricopeptide (TPR) repeat protein
MSYGVSQTIRQTQTAKGKAMKRVLESAAMLSAIILAAGTVNAQSTKPAAQAASGHVEARILSLLNEGKQVEAEALLAKQRVVFLTACCLRSRFMVQDSFPIFKAIAQQNGDSVEGQCASHILYLDMHKNVEEHFEALRKLADDNPNDVMLRWMVAVQCRALHKNEEGVKQYKKILEKWKPGPVLVHQSYGNMLDELGRYDEALVERRKSVELDPAPWSYQGLGNTLASLKQFDKANEAYAKSIELAPDNSGYWQSWAWGLERQGNFNEAIVKAKKSIDLNPKEWQAWSVWGGCLKSQGKPDEALAKYRKALEINPDDDFVSQQVKALEGSTQSPPKPTRKDDF